MVGNIIINKGGGGIHLRALKGRKKIAAGKAVRPPPAGTDARNPRGRMEYADTAPRLGRGRDRSEHGAKRSKADSPTATAGSRAAQIKNKS